MVYIKTSWVNDSPPPINASNLNKMEDGIEAAHIAIASTDVALGSAVAYASTLYANISANASGIVSIPCEMCSIGLSFPARIHPARVSIHSGYCSS